MHYKEVELGFLIANCIVNVLIPVFVLQGFYLATYSFT